MESFKRYRVRSASKPWSSDGPDLLRKRSNAEKQIGKVIPIGTRHLKFRIRGADGWGEWSRSMSRKRLLRRLHSLEFVKGDELVQIARFDEVKAEMKIERVELVDLRNAHRDVEVTWSLMHHAHPNVLFAGAFVFKQVAGTSSWSDHAWGDAVDGTPRGEGVNNDQFTDWCVRMAKTGNMPVHGYFVGSKGGRVHSAKAPRFRLVRGGGDDSHEWHVHASIVDHDGAKPPRVPFHEA